MPLYAGLTFADFEPKLFSFTPPAGCSAPWAKVVLAADFAVTAGRQFDRTGGFVDTSHGRVRTEIDTAVRFTNRQRFDITAALYHQRIAQTTGILVRTRTEERNRRTEQIAQLEWPLTVDFAFATNPDGSPPKPPRSIRSSSAATPSLATAASPASASSAAQANGARRTSRRAA